MNQESQDLNNFLESLDQEYETHQVELEQELEKERQLFGTYKTQEKTTEEEQMQNKHNGSNIDRELDLWGRSSLDFSLMDRDSFRASGSKNDNKINERLNQRHEYPKVLPFQRDMSAFQIRPQRSKDLEDTYENKINNRNQKTKIILNLIMLI